MKVLFVCRFNIFRSQIAEGLFKKIAEKNEVKSAGTMVSENKEDQKLKERTDEITRNIIKIMLEEGIDIRENERKVLTEELVDWADKIVCMAQKETIPNYLIESEKVEYWDVEDTNPGRDYEFYIETKENIKKLVEKFIDENGL